jgi:hypothetical protein
MNYAVVVASGVWLFAVVYWFFPRIGGKTFFTYVSAIGLWLHRLN